VRLLELFDANECGHAEKRFVENRRWALVARGGRRRGSWPGYPQWTWTLSLPSSNGVAATAPEIRPGGNEAWGVPLRDTVSRNYLIHFILAALEEGMLR
jgi:hypothetical protein